MPALVLTGTPLWRQTNYLIKHPSIKTRKEQEEETKKLFEGRTFIQAIQAAAEMNIILSTKLLREAGFSIRELIDQGYSVMQLRAAGYSLSEIVAAGLPEYKLEQAGIITPKDSTQPIVAPPPPSVPSYLPKAPAETAAAPALAPVPSFENRVVERLKRFGFDPKKLEQLGITAEILKTVVGLKDEHLKTLGYDLNKLGSNKLGLTPAADQSQPRLEFVKTVRENNIFTVAQLRKMGFTAQELKKAGYTAYQLRRGGYNARALREADYTPEELKKAGYSAGKLLAAGYNQANLQQIGFTPADLAGSPRRHRPNMTEFEAERRARRVARQQQAMPTAHPASNQAATTARTAPSPTTVTSSENLPSSNDENPSNAINHYSPASFSHTTEVPEDNPQVNPDYMDTIHLNPSSGTWH